MIRSSHLLRSPYPTAVCGMPETTAALSLRAAAGSEAISKPRLGDCFGEKAPPRNDRCEFLSSRRMLRLFTLLMLAGVWLMVAVPALAQEETPEPSMVQELLSEPGLAGPLVVPMILALGGVLTLIAALAWLYGRLPEDGEA